jgi:anti-sigma B factor antagonist
VQPGSGPGGTGTRHHHHRPPLIHCRAERSDGDTAPELRVALLAAVTDGPGTLVADMTRTRFCDSSGLHALLAAHKRAQAKGGELLLVIPSTAVLRIFAITGIDGMISNFTSLDQALAHISPGGLDGRLLVGPPVPR